MTQAKRQNICRSTRRWSQDAPPPRRLRLQRGVASLHEHNNKGKPITPCLLKSKRGQGIACGAHASLPQLLHLFELLLCADFAFLVRRELGKAFLLQLLLEFGLPVRIRVGRGATLGLNVGGGLSNLTRISAIIKWNDTLRAATLAFFSSSSGVSRCGSLRTRPFCVRRFGVRGF